MESIATRPRTGVFRLVGRKGMLQQEPGGSPGFRLSPYQLQRPKEHRFISAAEWQDGSRACNCPVRIVPFFRDCG
jgi:hypothetical protein